MSKVIVSEQPTKETPNQGEREDIEVLKKIAVDAVKTAKIYVIVKLSITGLIWVLYTALAVVTIITKQPADLTNNILGVGALVAIVVSFLLLETDHLSFLDKFK